eukprot:tig00000144_g9162.t1
MADTFGRVKAAAVFGQDGGVWCTQGMLSTDLTRASKETVALTQGINDIAKLQTNGIVIDGTKYTYLGKTASGAVFGKKPLSTSHVLATLSNTAVVIALLKDGISPSSVPTVDSVAGKHPCG